MNEGDGRVHTCDQTRQPPDAPRTEAEYLHIQSRMAKEALGRALGEVGQDLLRCAHASHWTKQFPLGTTAGAFVLGLFASGYAARHLADRRSRRRRQLDRLRRRREECWMPPPRVARKAGALFRLIYRWVGHALEVWAISLMMPRPTGPKEIETLPPREEDAENDGAPTTP